jgi:hypothetical protein
MTWPAFGTTDRELMPVPPAPRPARLRRTLTAGLVLLITAAVLVLAWLVVAFIKSAPGIPSAPTTPIPALTGPAVLPSAGTN